MALETGSIVNVTATETTVTIEYEPIEGAAGYQVVHRPYYEFDNLTYHDAGTKLSYTITELEPKTHYMVNYRGIDADGKVGPFTTGVDIWTKAPPFNWTYSGINPETGRPEEGSTKIPGYGLYITSGEWNELVGSVNALLNKRIGAVSGDDVISAKIVNEVATALGVDNIMPGDAIRASFFNQLRAACNALR